MGGTPWPFFGSFVTETLREGSTKQGVTCSFSCSGNRESSLAKRVNQVLSESFQLPS